MNSKDILEHKKGFRAKKYNKKYIDPMKKSDTMIEPDKPKNQKKDESTSMKTTVSEYKGKTDQERIDAFRKQAKDLKDKGFVKAADDTEKLSKTLYKKKDKAVAEGAKWRNHPDAYNVDDEGNKTPRNPNSPKFGYDPLQRRADTANDAK
ncbi:hypothetical protein EB118_10030, partial [bacterium]|nr:hypothetical protein [bacterium]